MTRASTGGQHGPPVPTRNPLPGEALKGHEREDTAIAEWRQGVFDRFSPAEENQEEKNPDADGQKSQQEDFQGTVSLPLGNSPVKILFIFGAWLSIIGPVRGKSRHAFSSSPKIKDYEPYLLGMHFPVVRFRFPSIR
ncbi:MAG: hypothetical protein HKM29_00795 [Deltaproteobacteria bacterium]|nr:hypothetical protein [Deltaproteobacteria bacterium]